MTWFNCRWLKKTTRHRKKVHVCLINGSAFRCFLSADARPPTHLPKTAAAESSTSLLPPPSLHRRVYTCIVVGQCRRCTFWSNLKLYDLPAFPQLLVHHWMIYWTSPSVCVFGCFSTKHWPTFSFFPLQTHAPTNPHTNTEKQILKTLLFFPQSYPHTNLRPEIETCFLFL